MPFSVLYHLFCSAFLAHFAGSAFNLDFSNLNTPFTYREFPYKESTKNEVTYKEYETACAAGNACKKYEGLSHELCVRRCISPSCYQDIYQSDQLEEGEVDVRLNSFKGCFIQRYNRLRP